MKSCCKFTDFDIITFKQISNYIFFLKMYYTYAGKQRCIKFLCVTSRLIFLKRDMVFELLSPTNPCMSPNYFKLNLVAF